MAFSIRNNIHTLPREVNGLTNLTELDLNDNKLAVMPRSYTKLVKLRVRTRCFVDALARCHALVHM